MRYFPAKPCLRSGNGISGLARCDPTSAQRHQGQLRLLCDILPPPTLRLEAGASRSSTATRTVSTSYPRVSHGFVLCFMPTLFSYLRFVCLQRHLYLCRDVSDSKCNPTLLQTSLLFRDFGIRKYCIPVSLQRTYLPLPEIQRLRHCLHIQIFNAHTIISIGYLP